MDALIYANSEDIPNRIYLKLEPNEIEIIDLNNNHIPNKQD